jgi:hypothetical protein
VQTQEGRVLTPRIGDVIPTGAEITTGRTGELHIATADSGYVALRPNTRLRITEYRADGGVLDTQILALMRGTFRSITGWIGKSHPERYRVTTPAATIGVRGTDHEPSYWLAEDLEAGADLEPGTYDKVNEGASFIENEAGRIDVARGHAGFARLHGRPARLGRVPKMFKATALEARIVERRESLKKVREQRRAERLARTRDRMDRLKDQRLKRRDRD